MEFGSEVSSVCWIGWELVLKSGVLYEHLLLRLGGRFNFSITGAYPALCFFTPPFTFVKGTLQPVLPVYTSQKQTKNFDQFLHHAIPIPVTVPFIVPFTVIFSDVLFIVT